MSRTRTELVALQERNAWEKNPKLTMADCRRMSTAEYEWREVFDAENLARAINEKEEKRRTQETANVAQAQKLFSGQEKPDAALLDEQNRWKEVHPQFPQDEPILNANLLAMAGIFSAENLLPTYGNIQRAFEQLTLAGKLTLDGSMFGGPSSLTGLALQRFVRSHPKILDAVKSATERQKIDEMSAKQFKKASKLTNPEDWAHENEIPGYVLDRIQKAVISFTTLHPEYERSHVNQNAILKWCRENDRPNLSLNDIEDAFKALVTSGTMKENSKAIAETPSGVTVRTDFQNTGKHLGYPVIEKDSLRKSVRSMSAADYASWLQESTANREAFDE